MGSGKLFGGAKGAASGAALGSPLGPVGTLLGAGIGSVVGYSTTKNKKGQVQYKPIKVPTYNDIINSDPYKTSYQNTLNSLRGEIDSNQLQDSHDLTNRLNAQNQLGSSFANKQRTALGQQYSQYYAQADEQAKQAAFSSYKDQANSAVRPYLNNLGQGSTSPSYTAPSSGDSFGNTFGSLLNSITLANVLGKQGTYSLGSRRFF